MFPKYDDAERQAQERARILALAEARRRPPEMRRPLVSVTRYDDGTIGIDAAPGLTPHQISSLIMDTLEQVLGSASAS